MEAEVVYVIIAAILVLGLLFVCFYWPPVLAILISIQRTDFAALLHRLGQASFAEIEKVMQEREVVKAEKGLTPEVVKRLRNRIANQQRPA